MKAMVLKEICEIKVEGGAKPLELVDLPVPKPGPKEILIKVLACGVCRTELDQIEGRIAPPKLPVIPGHQPVGIIDGSGVRGNQIQNWGSGWSRLDIFQLRTMQVLPEGEENLCDQFQGDWLPR